jgi:pimeloyl-ACP methyl ester carboxylesterase
MDFLLVHGSTQSPAGYDRLAAALGRRGHRAVAADLPVDRPELVAADYAALVAEQAAGLTEPVLVAHSAGGALVPAVSRAVGARQAVWLAAVVPDAGRSVLDEARADPGMFGPEWPSWTGDLTDEPAETAYFLFHDCDLATLRWALSTVRLFPPATVFGEVPERVEVPPSTYLLPVEDRTLTPAWMRRVARERLGTEAVEVPGGHCPHVSRPEHVAALLDR